MRTVATVCSVFLSLAISKVSLGENAVSGPLASVEGITEYRLENGLQLLLFPDPSKPTVTVNLTIFVGSRHEGYGEAGMAHLLEHMLFKGTAVHSNIPKELQRRGADFNGTTSLDRTNYYETLPARDDNLEFAIRMEADRLVNSLIRGEDLASEMTVVRNEFESGENSPQEVLHQRMMAAAFEWHNYGRSTIGNRADIERVPITKLRSFYRNYYQPDNAMLVVAGQFDPEQALQLVAEHFGSIPKPQRELDKTYTEEPVQDGERLISLQRAGQVPIVAATYHVPSGAHPDFAAVDLLGEILTGDPHGRLYRGLVQTRKAASVSGGAYSLHDPGILMMSADVAGALDPQTVLDELHRITSELASAGPTDEETEQARAALLKERELAATDSAQLAIDLSEWASMGDWRLYFIYRDRLENVTTEDIRRVAAEYLLVSNRTVGVFRPTSEAARAVIPSTPDVAKMVAEYQGRESVATGAAFDVQPEAIEGRTERLALPSGLQVALLPKKTRGEAVQLFLTLRYGSVESLRGATKACELLPQLMTHGTRKLNRQQLQSEWDKYRVEIQASGKPGEMTLVLKTKREHLARVLELVRQVLREPALDESEFEVLKQADLAKLAQVADSPEVLAPLFVNRQVNPYSPEDPRAIPSIEQEMEQLRQLVISDVRRLYELYLNGAHGELAIVGDFDTQQVLPSLRSIFDGWRSDKPYQRMARSGKLAYEPTAESIHTPDKANAAYFAGLVLPMRDDDPDYPALVIGNYVLGGGSGLSSRLGDRVRQQEGLSYGIGSGLNSSAIDARTTFSIIAITNPLNMDKLRKVIRDELEHILRSGITAEELAAAQKGYLQELELERANDLSLAGELAESLHARRNFTYNVKFQESIRQLTVEQVNSVLTDRIDPQRLVEAMAGDLK